MSEASTNERLNNPAAATAPVKAHADSVMADAADAPSPAPLVPSGAGRTGTPVRNTAATSAGERLESSSSRAASVHPESAFVMPAELPSHGAPVRQYINAKVTATLLEGMKLIAVEQPKDPLRVLGEFLLKKSKELEGTK